MTTPEAVNLIQERVEDLISNTQMQKHLAMLKTEKNFSDKEITEYVALAAIATLFGADIPQAVAQKSILKGGR